MYDKERLGKILGDMERYFADLESLKIRSASDLKDRKNFYSASMLAFSIINRAIDLGEEMVSANNLGTPGTYKDIFYLLERGGFINAHMKKQLSELSSFRNLFSHEYQDFTEKDVFEALHKAGVAREFARKMKTRIS